MEPQLSARITPVGKKENKMADDTKACMIEFTITEAYVSGEALEADEPIVFRGDTWMEESIDGLAQRRGKELWKEIYREKADRVFYTHKNVEDIID